MREQIGHYQILKKLGAGGMGEVYLAQDTRLGRRAALKILPDNFASDSDRMSRFIREAKAASSLSHPNVATIYDVGNVDGTSFIAMEYVEGQTLAARTSDSALTTNEIVEIGVQLVDALDTAHAAGVTHRDIKPANVMLTPRGQVKVLDFGLAKISRPDESTGNSQLPTTDGTIPGLVMGTVDYMSPEQVLGHEVDHRSDIFSLGVVLYEMAARRRPFTGSTVTETMDHVLHAPYEPITADGKFPVELDRIIRKCLEKDRESRYQTARDVWVDLKNLQRDGRSRIAAPSVPASTPVRVRPVSRVLPALVALALLVVVGVLGFAWWNSSSKTIESVAVLPFTNEGGNPETEYLADGITESVISNLAQLSHLSVQSRSSVFRFKGIKMDPQLAGQEMRVQAVLVGRVIPRDDRIAINWELIDVEDGRQIVGDQFEQKLDDLLQVQTEIAREVSANLQPRLSEAERQHVVRRPTDNPEAYQLYLKGRFAWSQATEEGFNDAIKYFKAALDKDPNYALAYVGLADSYIGLGADYMSPNEAMPTAKVYAQEALKRNDGLAEAHTSLGVIRLIYDWDWLGAEREFQNNITLSPQTVETFTCSLHWVDPLGRNEEAIDGIRRALKVDPFSMSTNLELGCASYYGHHYEQAIAQFKKALTLYPGHAGLTFGLARASTQTGKYREAIDALSAVKTSSGNWPPIVAELAYANARLGNKAEARKILQELKDQSAHRYVDPYLVAVIQLSLGDKEQAFAWLNKAYDQRSGWLPWLTLEPKWSDLHSDSRFTDLARRVGLARG